MYFALRGDISVVSQYKRVAVNAMSILIIWMMRINTCTDYVESASL